MTVSLPTKKILYALLFISLLTFLSTTSFAQEGTQSSVETTGIQVSAPTYTFEINPGSVGQEIIKVKNVGNKRQTFYPEVLDFRPNGETGAAEFINTKEAETYTYSLSSWISLSKKPIVLDPDKSTALNFNITVPASAEPGGRYAGILFGTQPPDPGAGQVAISNKVGSLVLVRIAGDAKEVATLKEFASDKTNYDKGPVNFVVRVENSGNVHVVPKGTIEIKNLFGSKQSVLNVNENNGNVLPESIRRFDKENGLSWAPKGFTFGRYAATVTLTYGDPTKTLTGSVSFWIIPWVQIAIALVILVVLALLIFFGVKRYNRYIVSKALKNKSANSNQPQP